jgi:hypothetical protein
MVGSGSNHDPSLVSASNILQNGVIGNFSSPTAATSFCPVLRDQLLWHLGELEIHACIVIYFLRRSEIKLIKRYIAVMLIPDIKCGARQEVIMNLHRSATVFEDKCDRVLALQS